MAFCGGLYKSFDRVDHKLLVNKLNLLRFSDSLVKLLWFYFQIANVDAAGFHSSKFTVKSGVLLGSNLGPLLFLLFIINIIEIFNLQALLFADDLKLLSVVTCSANYSNIQNNLGFLN